MRYPLLTSLALSVFSFSSLAAVPVIEDTFNADLDGTNPNTAVNKQAAARQSGGTTTTTYSKSGVGSDAMLHTPNSGSFSGETALLLRTTPGSNTGVRTDTNFASALAGKAYTIEFEGLISVTGTPAPGNWGSFFLSDDASAISPNQPPVDYGILYRERDANNVSVFKNGSGVTSTAADGGTSLFNDGTPYTFSIMVDEVNGTVDTIINAGQSNEIALTQTSIAFSDNTKRYFGFRANQGAGGSGGQMDFHYDNFTVSVVPEPSVSALLAGIFGLTWVMLRRRTDA